MREMIEVESTVGADKGSAQNRRFSEADFTPARIRNLVLHEHAFYPQRLRKATSRLPEQLSCPSRTEFEQRWGCS